VWLKLVEQVQALSSNHRTGAGGVTQVIELLPSKHEALSSNPGLKKNKKEPSTEKNYISIYALYQIFFISWHKLVKIPYYTFHIY
jgi:hypothetical protein